MPGLPISSCHWPTCLFIEQREPIHLAACEAERRFGMKDACELSRWLPARARGAGFCRQRDSEAAGWDTRRSYISMNRAVGRGVARGDGGDPFVGGTLWDTENGAALQITSLVRLPGSIRHDSPPAEPNFSYRGAGVRSGASRLCAPVYADSSTIWRSVGRNAATATWAAT